jgi:two-component system, NtrC family, sensor kinase
MLNKDKQLHLEQAKNQKQQTYALLVGLVLAGASGMLLVRNNRQKHKVNVQLHQQKKEIQHTLNELKSTQAQLVHREKMASLGELTAGIAHEIQNPLNFVNNFSQVSEELLEELKDGPIKRLPAKDRTEADELISDISTNLEKIFHHGKRADSIVKGMLQHSRSSPGQRELTDINSLADEFLRLSFHGFRATDKSFNATIKTDYDPDIQKVEVNPSDLGRVFLNLFSNAFYSLSEKQKQAGPDYDPQVCVSTRRLAEGIEIHIRDNGRGIPKQDINRIFQPFFTTKPTGKGTGLGLSLSYDIITKLHNGQLRVETVEDSFAEFIIVLPVSQKQLIAEAV